MPCYCQAASVDEVTFVAGSADVRDQQLAVTRPPDEVKEDGGAASSQPSPGSPCRGKAG